MINFSTKSKIYLGSAISKLLTKILGASDRVIKRDKIYYKINLGEGIDLGIFLGLKNERKIFNVANFLKNNRKNIIIDIGSNVGSVTLPLAKKFQNSIIISIEPTKYAFKKLLFNTNLNPDLKKRIKLINSFVTNKKKAANKVHASWNFSNAKNKSAPGPSTHLPLIALSSPAGICQNFSKPRKWSMRTASQRETIFLIRAIHQA